MNNLSVNKLQNINELIFKNFSYKETKTKDFNDIGKVLPVKGSIFTIEELASNLISFFFKKMKFVDFFHSTFFCLNLDSLDQDFFTSFNNLFSLFPVSAFILILILLISTNDFSKFTSTGSNSGFGLPDPEDNDDLYKKIKNFLYKYRYQIGTIAVVSVVASVFFFSGYSFDSKAVGALTGAAASSLSSSSCPEAVLDVSPAVSSPAVSSPAVSSPAVSSPAVSSPAVSSPAVSSPAVSSPAVSSPAVSSPAVSSPAVSSPAVSSPAVSSPAVSSPAVRQPSIIPELMYKRDAFLETIKNLPCIELQDQFKSSTPGHYGPQDFFPKSVFINERPFVFDKSIDLNYVQICSGLINKGSVFESNLYELKNYIWEKMLFKAEEPQLIFKSNKLLRFKHIERAEMLTTFYSRTLDLNMPPEKSFLGNVFNKDIEQGRHVLLKFPKNFKPTGIIYDQCSTRDILTNDKFMVLSEKVGLLEPSHPSFIELIYFRKNFKGAQILFVERLIYENPLSFLTPNSTRFDVFKAIMSDDLIPHRVYFNYGGQIYSWNCFYRTALLLDWEVSNPYKPLYLNFYMKDLKLLAYKS